MANPAPPPYRVPLTVSNSDHSDATSKPSTQPDRATGGGARHFVIAALLAIALYAGGFTLDQHLRHRRGPWELTFATNSADQPTLTIRQPSLQIDQVTLVFPGWTWTNASVPVRFEQPRTPVPFGRVKHEDLTSLPGVVTLELFGHEVELLPRTLLINRKEVPWHPKLTLILAPEDAPGPLPEPRKPSRSPFAELATPRTNR